MSTRSRIAIQKEDGGVASIYCHFDGYINGVGKTLKKHYNDEEKATNLIEGGDISVLKNSTDTTVYYKDRGDDWDTIKPQVHRSLNGLMASLRGDIFIEFVYLYADGKWQVSELQEHEDSDNFFEYSAYHNKFKPLLYCKVIHKTMYQE
tara:strand:- start:126 stop:572 length:447 start_codon:yes stop_codon:yes gene_type:complete